MEQPNSGSSILEAWDDQQGWVPFLEAYLLEATEYKLRFKGQADVRIQGIPVPSYKEHDQQFAVFITPFQCGLLKVFINGVLYETYVYTDNRKLTEEQFNWMLEEILEEANICFQMSGLATKVNVLGKSRDISWTQWLYIENSFYQLKQIFSKIEKQPFRRLEKYPLLIKREKVQHSEQITLQWLDQKGFGNEILSNVQNIKTLETINLYENQVLKQQLIGLYQVLCQYETLGDDTMFKKSFRYKSIVKRWLNSTFLREVRENEGPFTITQKFRKHPIYRLWYLWFERLYKHDRKGIGFDYPISLKDTFQLYEMWCYMKIVKIIREAGLILDTSGLYRTTKNGVFLDLADNNRKSDTIRGWIFPILSKNLPI